VHRQKELIALQDGALERQDPALLRVKNVPCHGERGAPSPRYWRAGMSATLRRSSCRKQAALGFGANPLREIPNQGAHLPERYNVHSHFLASSLPRVRTATTIS